MSELATINPQEIDFSINSESDLIRLNAVLRGVIETEKNIADKLDPEIANANKTHKGLTALKKSTLEPFVAVRSKINESIKSWYSKKEEEAKKLQEQINLQLAQQAEEVKQKMINDAESLNEWDKEIVKEQSNNVVAVTVEAKDCLQTVLPKQEGQYKRSNWKARVVNEDVLPRAFLIPNEAALNTAAKQEAWRMSGIMGVEFYDDFTIVTKA